MDQEIVKLELNKELIMEALEKALKNNFMDNLRKRSPFVQLDSKIRGYIGELSLKRWFEKEGIFFEETNYLDDGTNIDIDFLYNNGCKIILELKTSLIPDVWFNIKNTLLNADIKLIKRSKKIADLKGDFHLQVYFNKMTNERDNFLKFLNEEILVKKDLDLIFDSMKLEEYEVLFVSWIDKNSLIEYIETLVKKGINPTWKFGFRDFWKCPINKIGKKPSELIGFLKNYKN